MELKNVRRGRISEYADKFKGTVFTPARSEARSQSALEHQGRNAPFRARPRMKLTTKDADNLLKNGVYVVSEGANMPTSDEGSASFSAGGNSLWSGQSGKRGRGCYLRAGDGAKQHAHFLDTRGSRRAALTKS